MKYWIEKMLINNKTGKLIPKRCTKDWFCKNGHEMEYLSILNLTNFLNHCSINPTFIQRLWHIYNNSFEMCVCENDGCDVVTNFKSFLYGYYKNCSYQCAQSNKSTIEKIKVSNAKKFGTEYYTQTDEYKKKVKQSCIEKYGVDNVSKLEEVKNKKKNTCLKNHGVESLLSDTKWKESKIIDKYGVSNVQQIPSVKNKTIKTRRGKYYDYICTSDRLKNLARPLFSKEDYVNGGLYMKYEFECNSCNKTFTDCLEDGDLPRCPSCYANTSNFEKDVYNYLKEIYDGNIDMNNRKLLNGIEVDLYINELNIAIECDGIYWHSENSGGKNKNYHLNKTEKCEKSGIRLIHIFEDEWMLNRELVKSKLKHILGKNDDKIYARNCEVRSVNRKDADKFLRANHIQGIDKSSIKIGLYSSDKLIMLATFGKNRMVLGNKNTKKDEYELYRLCSSINVIGGASKLINHFIKIYKPSKLTSYADRRWSNNDSFYKKIGFNFAGYTRPNYWYIGKYSNYKKWHRFSFAKHKLSKKLKIFDDNLSEWENMKNNGWDRIWDCGNIKYEMIF